VSPPDFDTDGAVAGFVMDVGMGKAVGRNKFQLFLVAALWRF